MKPESICERMRREISARLDGELDDAAERALDQHLPTCPECRSHEAKLQRVRTRLRVTEAPSVPDLTQKIMQRVAVRGPRERKRDDVRTGFRIGGLTAAAAALLVLGTSIPFVSEQPQTAAASEITRQVRAAAQALDTYRASFSIVERGYNDAIGTRRFVAKVAFDAPERFRLQVRDLTTYPDERWPLNDIDLIANEQRWWIREPSTCPAAALPACAVGADTEIRSIIERQPFDGTSALPTDIIVPLETLASSERFEVLGSTTIAGREVQRVSLDYRDAIPLVNALEPGGLWRGFHPLDEVIIWIDSETWFPLRYDVVASDAKERALWAGTQGYKDRPGEHLLSVRATEFARTEVAPQGFEAPKTGVMRNGDFDARDFAETRSWIAPAYRAGLRPYRAGVVGGQRVLTYARGMTWLKITATRSGRGFSNAVTAQEIELAGGFAYYQPATEALKRRVDVIGLHSVVRLESNLPRAELLRVAGSLDIAGRRLPRVIERDRARTVVRLESGPRSLRPSWVQRPTYLPPGYRVNATILSRSRDGGKTLTLYYRGNEAEYGGDGIRITQSPTIELLAPTGEEDLLGIRINNVVARWFPQRGELEWIDGDEVYRSVTVDSFDLSTAVRVARSFR